MWGGGVPVGQAKTSEAGKETQRDRHRDGERRSEIRRGRRGRRDRGSGEKEAQGGRENDSGLEERDHTQTGMETPGPAPAPPRPRPHQPSTGALSSSETPKDMAPMKSLREVRSQSHTSTLSLRSTSPGFRLLREGWGAVRGSAPGSPHLPILGAGGGGKPRDLGSASCSVRWLPTSEPPRYPALRKPRQLALCLSLFLPLSWPLPIPVFSPDLSPTLKLCPSPSSGSLSFCLPVSWLLFLSLPPIRHTTTLLLATASPHPHFLCVSSSETLSSISLTLKWWALMEIKYRPVCLSLSFCISVPLPQSLHSLLPLPFSALF